MFFLVLFSSCSNQKPANDVCILATVNNSVLTCDEGERLLLNFPAGSTTLSHIVSLWVDRELLYQSGIKNNFDKDLNIVTSVQDFQKKQIGNAYLSSVYNHKYSITKDEVRKYYKSNLTNYVRKSSEAKVVHFKFDDEKTARKVKKALSSKLSGEKRKELFSLYNVDVMTVKKGTLVSSLNKAIFTTRKNVVGPVKTSHGYHVVEVVDRFKKGSQIGLEQVYDEIYQRLVNQQLSKARVEVLDSLRSEALIKINVEKLQ